MNIWKDVDLLDYPQKSTERSLPNENSGFFGTIFTDTVVLTDVAKAKPWFHQFKGG